MESGAQGELSLSKASSEALFFVWDHQPELPLRLNAMEIWISALLAR